MEGWCFTWAACICQVTQTELIHSSNSVSTQKKKNMHEMAEVRSLFSVNDLKKKKTMFLCISCQASTLCMCVWVLTEWGKVCLPFGWPQAPAAEQAPNGAWGWELRISGIEHHAEVFGYYCRLCAVLHLTEMEIIFRPLVSCF